MEKCFYDSYKEFCDDWEERGGPPPLTEKEFDEWDINDVKYIVESDPFSLRDEAWMSDTDEFDEFLNPKK